MFSAGPQMGLKMGGLCHEGLLAFNLCQGKCMDRIVCCGNPLLEANEKKKKTHQQSILQFAFLINKKWYEKAMWQNKDKNI